MVLLSLCMTRCRGVWPSLVGRSAGNLYSSTKTCRHASLPLWAAKWMAVKPCGGQRRQEEAEQDWHPRAHSLTQRAISWGYPPPLLCAPGESHVPLSHSRIAHPSPLPQMAFQTVGR